MCTLTVERGAGRLLVTMNRDELRTRAPELPPRQHGTTQAAWHEFLDDRTQVLGAQSACRQLGCQRCKDVAAVEGRTWLVDAQFAQDAVFEPSQDRD